MIGVEIFDGKLDLIVGVLDIGVDGNLGALGGTAKEVIKILFEAVTSVLRWDNGLAARGCLGGGGIMG